MLSKRSELAVSAKSEFAESRNTFRLLPRPVQKADTMQGLPRQRSQAGHNAILASAYAHCMRKIVDTLKGLLRRGFVAGHSNHDPTSVFHRR